MKRMKWTQAEIQILKDNYPTFDVPQLAIKLHRSKKSVSMKIHKLGLFKNKYNLPEDLKKSLQGSTLNKIAETLNVSRQKARTYIKYNNIRCSHIRWTPEEDKILIDNYQNMFLKDLHKTFFPYRRYKAVKSRKETLKLLKKDRGKLLVGYIVGEDHPNWEGGISFEPYCHKFNEALKEKVRNAFNRSCLMCGITESELMHNMIAADKRPCKLHIHHIGAEKQQGCNGITFQLVPLCPSCHMTLHWKPELEKILIKKYKDYEQKFS